MKKSELKKMLKPLIKECIHEVLIEDGMLSGVVSEVVKGLGTQVIAESSAPQQHAPPQIDKGMEQNLQQQRMQSLREITKGAYNGVDIFEGTEAMTSYESQAPRKGATDLGDPRDAGVDISSLVGMSSQIWQAIK